jgi:hypothetical protein
MGGQERRAPQRHPGDACFFTGITWNPPYDF